MHSENNERERAIPTPEQTNLDQAMSIEIPASPDRALGDDELQATQTAQAELLVAGVDQPIEAFNEPVHSGEPVANQPLPSVDYKSLATQSPAQIEESFFPGN